MKKLIETILAWGLIYFGLWVLTGKWGFAISDDGWRVAVLVSCLIIVRVSAYSYGRWERGKEALND